MKISNEQADYLLKLPKKIIANETILEDITMDQHFPFTARYELISEQDAEFSFLWEIKQSKKNSLRVSLHYQEDDSKIGLLRIDYNGGHTNPETINEFAPIKFHDFAGKAFGNEEHHIHYHVEGYRSLAWALPLTNDDFAVKELKENDFNNTFAQVIKYFAKTISIETKITINPLLL
jgi:hypothetical protein